MGSGGKKTFKRSEQMKKKIGKKNFFCRCNFTTFMSKSFQILDHFFPLLFSKDSENLKSLHIGLRKIGAKIPLKGVRNTNTRKTCSVRQNSPQNKLFFTAILHPLLIKVFQSETTSLHYFSPRILNL